MTTKPHPDCKAQHVDPHEYVGPTHACAGADCPAPEHKRGVAHADDRTHFIGDGCPGHGIPDTPEYTRSFWWNEAW